MSNVHDRAVYPAVDLAAELLWGAFAWDDTEEGLEYWASVQSTLSAIVEEAEAAGKYKRVNWGQLIDSEVLGKGQP